MYHILIIEDDKIQNDVLAGFLRKDGYQVSSAYTIKNGQTLFDSTVHLIVLDVNLPDGSGLEYLKKLRTQSTVPVIVLTALNDELTQSDVFELEADAYIDKPISPFILTKQINALMKRFYNDPETVTIQGIEFDFINYYVRKEKEEIHLTATEFQVIKLIYQGKGMTIPKERILSLVWGPEYQNDHRLLDPHIKNIRKKLHPDMITTIKEFVEVKLFANFQILAM